MKFPCAPVTDRLQRPDRGSDRLRSAQLIRYSGVMNPHKDSDVEEQVDERNSTDAGPDESDEPFFEAVLDFMNQNIEDWTHVSAERHDQIVLAARELVSSEKPEVALARQDIADKFRAAIEQILANLSPFEMALDRAFAELKKCRLLTSRRQHCCRSCAQANLERRSRETGAEGMVFYSEQDAEYLDETSSVYLSYQSCCPEAQGDAELLADCDWVIGNIICAVMMEQGLHVTWDGDTGKTILVQPVLA